MSDEVVAPVALAEAACHDPLEEAWKRLTATLHDSVVGVVRTAAERHREAIASQSLEADPPEEWKVRAERLLEYRRTVRADFLEPLAGLFARGGPVALVDQALGAGLQKAVDRCAALPTKATAPWPEGALDPKPSDTADRRVGKVFARVFSRARRAGRERALPLRGVVARHMDRVLIPGQDRVAIAALDAWAEWSRRLEWACVHWGGSAMPALIRAERGEEDGGAEIWTSVRMAAQTLQTELEALSGADPAEEAFAAARSALGSSRGALAADLAVAGSFLLDPPDARPGSDHRDLKRSADALRDWEGSVGARFEMYASLLGVLSGATAVRRRAVWEFRDHCLANISDLGRIAEGLDALRADLMQPGEYGLRTRLDELDANVASVLESASRAIPDKATVDAALGDLSNTTIEALLGMIGQAPASLAIHDIEARAPTRGRRAERRPLPLQELARQSFDALRIERIRSSTAGLIDTISAVRAAVAELPGVYSFARDEALRELESTEEGAGDRADDLIGGALLSIADALRTQRAELDAGVANAQRRLAAEIVDGSMALVGRAEAGRVGARLLAARSRASKTWAWLRDSWVPPIQRGTRRVALVVARLRRYGARLLRKGSTLVGGAHPPASATRTLRSLAHTASLIESLPLVYQRLFTFAPLSDGSLMAGRSTDLAEAMRRWKRWHEDDGVPLIVQARHGSGITSFLNVFAAEIQKDVGTVTSSVLGERICDEAALAAYLAPLLGLAPASSMGQLAGLIFDADPASLPAAVFLDNLEHLYLRVPKGADLLERLLTLMAETEPRLFWIGGISASAWKLVSVAEPAAVSQVDVLGLEPLSSAAMREAITARHRRSGLALRYEEPTGGMHHLRRRWRQLRHSEVITSQAESDFFDRLHRTSGGYLSLALFQWLEAADFSSGDGVLMRHPERPDFSVLDTLDLGQNFTLKAFLEHRSLTLEEHDLVFRLPRQESYEVIESLRNRHILRPLRVPGHEDPESRSQIEEELRYEIHPLLIGAVIVHLQARNIVH